MSIDLADERTARIALAHATFPADSLTRRLIAEHGCAGTVQLALSGKRPPGITELGFDTWLSHTRAKLDPVRLERVFSQTEELSLTVFTPDDPEWRSSGLTDLGVRAPLALWARGDTTLLGRPRSERIAVAGARAGTQYGHYVARDLVAGLLHTGHTIVSTAATGTAATAHRAALIGGGQTIAVLAHGLARSFSEGTDTLIEQIAERGLALSEASPDQETTKQRFEQRERLLAALTAATVIVEASRTSTLGILIDEATALHRPIGAVPGPVTNGTSALGNRLINKGSATLIASAEDIRKLIADTADRSAATPRAGRSTARRNPLPSIDKIGRQETSDAPHAGLGR